ncbi:hypothetical protein [Caldivirga maquilingensis]|uniref:Uncharacterized protein n=1 Tax=Caldivirga maquilingensis (strain ATCC 700844 / DSM 13496 / JCM 10307 / IC-167) TaxID=397948 RepID=A8MCA8_CALMQ|nr:hypothetical protein [Caldivirga maquilingensis]ABW01414.1 hypothetical protein Cmaq_0573 [Caldivirga maquilingensis IC-167]
MIIETYDINGRRVLVAFTESGIAYRDITSVHRWYRRFFIPGIVASVLLVVGSIAYAIVMYQNAVVHYQYEPYYVLIGGFAVSLIILAVVRLSRPRVDWQAVVIPIIQVWSIIVYVRSGLVYVYRYGSQMPELTLKLRGRELVNLLNSLNNEPWVRKVMVYEQ